MNDLIHYPNKALYKQAESVDAPSEYKRVKCTMKQVLYNHNGVGVAAPQINKSLRIIIIRHDPTKRSHETYFNPQIISKENYKYDEEYCLSFPNIGVEVKRPTTVTFEAQTITGNTITQTVHGLTARCIQHEVDHLNGKTIIDRCGIKQKLAVQDKLSVLKSGEIPEIN